MTTTKTKTKHYVLLVNGGVTPALYDADSVEDQEDRAKDLHDRTDPDTDSVFWLDVHQKEDGTVIAEVGAFSGAFFADEDGE